MTTRRTHCGIVAGALIVTTLVGSASITSAGSSDDTTPGSTMPAAEAEGPTYADDGGLTRFTSPVELTDDIVTRGPDGEVPVWYTDLTLTSDEVAEVQGRGLRAAIVWHFTSPFMAALSAGAKQTFEELGVEVVSETSAEGDDAALQNNIQSALALDPDIMLSIALDPVADAAAFRPVVDAGVSLVFASVKPGGFRAGTDYVSLVTYDIAGLGQVTADAMGGDLGDDARVGVIYYDANFYVTNQREEVFLDTLQSDYPGIEIVAQSPMADPARVEEVANAMLTQHPEIEAIFAPWDTAAEGVVAALRQLGRDDVGVYTIDLGNTNALDMASGGVIREMTSTLAVEFGSTAAIAGAFGALDKEAPSMAVVPSFAVRAENLPEAWLATFGKPLPDDIAAALDAS